MPAITKHLKVLQRAGLVARGRRAQWRPCTLRAQPLREAVDWIARDKKLYALNSGGWAPAGWTPEFFAKLPPQPDSGRGGRGTATDGANAAAGQGGRGAARGVPGNMSAAEAVDLAARVRPRFVVPHHYDMFTFNTVPVEEFLAEARRLPAGVVPKVLRCGERWEIRP